jgi:hypothetical protein
MRNPLDKLHERIEHQDAADRAVETHTVFVAGPYIEMDKDLEHPTNSETDSKRLRYGICDDFRAAGMGLYMGEDVALRLAGEKNFGVFNNAVAYERHYIKKYTDVIISLPCSPGSFCEVGDWITSHEICNKTLIIIDASFEGYFNYINDGVVKMARTQGAQVKYLPYSDVPSILDVCRSFFEEIIAKKRMRALYDE